MKKYHFKNVICTILILTLLLVACGKNEESSNTKNEETKSADYEMLSKSESLIATDVTCITKTETPDIKVPSTTADEEGNFYSPTETGGQGGCFDGRYYYQSRIKYCYNETKNSNGKYVYSKCLNDVKNLVVIVKYDVELQKTVKVSEPMYLNHANDITYDSRSGHLIVVNGAPNKSTITFIDPETLEIKNTSKVMQDLYGIDYDKTTDRYVLGVSGSYGFSVVNALTDNNDIFYGMTESRAYTNQALCCDENYVFCVYYGNGTNKLTGEEEFTKDAIFVYNWDGDFVTFIEFDLGDHEPENISIVDDVLYVADGYNLYKISGFVAAE